MPETDGNAYTVSVGNPAEKATLGIPTRRWDNKTTTDLKYIEWIRFTWLRIG
jgi:hypothetical protein